MLCTTAKVLFIVSPVCCYWIAGTLLHLFLSTKASEKWRIHQKSVEDRNRVNLREAIKWVLFQHVLQMFLAYIAFDEPFMEEPEHIFIHIVKFISAMILLDTYQYWFHRWAHTNKFLYNNFHSWHHRLYCPYPLGALYNHPLEGIFMDTLGGVVAIQLSGMHQSTALLFACFSTLKTLFDHCNLVFPANPFAVFKNNSLYHDFHHQPIGLNYNLSQPFFTFWDDVMGAKWTPPLIEKFNSSREKEKIKIS
jgi:sphinganine C4-monooxygenase